MKRIAITSTLVLLAGLISVASATQIREAKALPGMNESTAGQHVAPTTCPKGTYMNEYGDCVPYQIDPGGKVASPFGSRADVTRPAESGGGHAAPTTCPKGTYMNEYGDCVPYQIDPGGKVASPFGL
jgi:hypothetical protein